VGFSLLMGTSYVSHGHLVKRKTWSARDRSAECEPDRAGAAALEASRLLFPLGARVSATFAQAKQELFRVSGANASELEVNKFLGLAQKRQTPCESRSYECSLSKRHLEVPPRPNLRLMRVE
jgi:hypothetical protein